MSAKKLSPRPTSVKPDESSRNKTNRISRVASHTSPRITNRIMTRARSKQFRLLDLPPELRNRIYSYALHEPEPPFLQDIRVPPLLHASQQIRSEALGLLTSLNTAKVASRCNYCVQGSHVSGTGHSFFKETGVIPIDTGREDWMLHHSAVFAGLEIDVGCSCCTPPRNIAGISIRHASGCFKVDAKVTLKCRGKGFKAPFQRIVEDVRGLVEAIKTREEFVGFGYEDLRGLVGCLRVSLVKEVVVLDD